jgi:hypothetical protein
LLELLPKSATIGGGFSFIHPIRERAIGPADMTPWSGEGMSAQSGIDRSSPADSRKASA